MDFRFAITFPLLVVVLGIVAVVAALYGMAVLAGVAFLLIVVTVIVWLLVGDDDENEDHWDGDHR